MNPGTVEVTVEPGSVTVLTGPVTNCTVVSVRVEIRPVILKPGTVVVTTDVIGGFVRL